MFLIVFFTDETLVQLEMVLLQKNTCMIAVEHFSVLKHSCILIGLCKVAENFCSAAFGGRLSSLLLNIFIVATHDCFSLK